MNRESVEIVYIHYTFAFISNKLKLYGVYWLLNWPWKSIINVHQTTFLNMGMTKAFGFFPTICQEYKKKQVDSRYFFYWDHSQFNNQLTINTHTLSLLSPNSHVNRYTSLQFKLKYALCSLKYFLIIRMNGPDNGRRLP